MATATLSVFVSVIACGALDDPTVTVPKLRSVGDNWMKVPVPVNDTVCGLEIALSVTLMLPVRVLSVVGLNLTVMLQLAPAATLVPQVLISSKSPLAAMLVMVNVAVPVLVRLITCPALIVFTSCVAKVKLAGERTTVAPPPTPTPDNETSCGLLAALSVIDKSAVSFPLMLGVKVTLI